MSLRSVKISNDCLHHEMLLTRELKPFRDVQLYPIRAHLLRSVTFFFFLFGLFSYSPFELLCSHYGFIGFNGAETNCGTAKLLGILQMNGYLSYGLQILRLRTTSLLSSLCRVNNYYKSICGLQLLNRELSKDKYNDGSENVGKKMNFRFFKLNRIYLDPIWTR